MRSADPMAASTSAAVIRPIANALVTVGATLLCSSTPLLPVEIASPIAFSIVG